MKNLFAITVAVAAVAFTASAQQAGLYTPLNGGTTRVLAASTNLVALGVTSTNQYGLQNTSSNLVQTVAEFDKVGFTWSYGAGSNATVLIYKSYDNATTFESVPSYTYTGPAATATAFSTNALLDLTGVSHVAVVIRNPSTIDMTNAYVGFNLKSPKYGAKAATR